MKKFALMCLFAAMTFGMASAQDTENKEIPANGAKIRFIETEHNYGTIMKGGDGKCQFTFVNEGNEPLILSNVKASCGCTTPSYTQKPVMPGQTGTIDVKYNTNTVGGFSKTVTVTSNAVDNPRVVLRIKGTVKQDPAVEGQQPQQPQQPQPTVKPQNRGPKPEVKPAREDQMKAVPAQAKPVESAK